MTVIHKDRTARVEHACAWDCGQPISPGDRYVASSLTPRDPDIGNTRWLHHALHGRSRYDCPDYAADRNAQAAKGDPDAISGDGEGGHGH